MQNALIDKKFYNPAPCNLPNPPTLDDGEFILYNGKGKGYDGDEKQKFSIYDANSTEGIVTSFVGLPINDTSDYIVFNLPKGVVLTLMENPVVLNGTYDFKGAGVIVDLMGTGTTETADLASCGAVNMLSAYVWRKPNLNAGFFQVWDAALPANTSPADWIGRRASFFLDEWTSDGPKSLSGWAYCDNLDGVSVAGLMANTISFYDGGNGEGDTESFNGWGAQTYATFQSAGLVNRIASWNFIILPPEKSEVDPASTKITGTVDAGATSGSSYQMVFSNGTSSVQTYTYKYKKKTTYTASSTTTCDTTNKVCISSKLEYHTPESAAALTGEASLEVNSTFKFKKKTTNETSTTSTDDTEISFSTDIQVNPMTISTVTGAVSVLAVKDQTQTTQAKYYYSQNIPGSTWDAVAGYYRLDVPVIVKISGSLAANYYVAATEAAYVPPA